MDTQTRVAKPPPRPLLVWDGDCRFCRAWITRWRAATGDRVDYEPSQSVGARFPEFSQEDYSKCIHLFMPDGRVFRGAEAAFETLAIAPGHGFWLKLYHKLPGFAAVTETGYKIVARNRTFFSFLTRLLWGLDSGPSTYRFGGALFVRMTGLIFLVAFLSYWSQSSALVGDGGIVPLKDYFSAVGSQVFPNSTMTQRLWEIPSLLWFEPNEAGLDTLLAAGTVCSMLVMAGLLPGWALLGCVITYASVRNRLPELPGMTFLEFQWDALLVETGFMALFVAPWGRRMSFVMAREPWRGGRWLVWWLTFKLMVMSGLVKIITNGSPKGPAVPGFFREVISKLTGVPIGENTWLDGTALQFHYFTQPIPSPASWWFAHLSPSFQAWSLWFTMFVEIVVPFGFFGPRRVRHIAALMQIALQVALMISGNYGFFNLLTIVLCLMLFDDAFWPGRVKRILERNPHAPTKTPADSTRHAVKIAGDFARGIAAILIVVTGLIQFWQTWESRTRERPTTATAPSIFDNVGHGLDLWSERAQRIGLSNTYGLFRVMTTERPELVISGSDDGQTWKRYAFVWKPGDPMGEPRFTGPNMPRLDWQMWFAALSVYYEHQIPPWFMNFLEQLRQGNPKVLALMDNNPFPGKPPRYLRIELYLYTFTTPEEHAKTGAWWTVPEKPVISLTATPKQ